MNCHQAFGTTFLREEVVTVGALPRPNIPTARSEVRAACDVEGHTCDFADCTCVLAILTQTVLVIYMLGDTTLVIYLFAFIMLAILRWRTVPS